MTEETLQNTENTSDDKTKDQSTVNNAPTESAKVKDGKKDKCRPMAKVRLLFYFWLLLYPICAVTSFIYL